jgi:hypothetical protein
MVHIITKKRLVEATRSYNKKVCLRGLASKTKGELSRSLADKGIKLAPEARKTRTKKAPKAPTHKKTRRGTRGGRRNKQPSKQIPKDLSKGTSYGQNL